MKPLHPLAIGLVLACFDRHHSAFADSFLLNPSFEQNLPGGVGYGPIDGWTGGTGVNEGGGPFHNPGTPVPDRNRVGFFQGAATLSQAVAGLEAGQEYWVQFFYDARACCGGTIDLVTEWDDAPVDTISNVMPVTGGLGYRFRNVIVTPSSDIGTLTFRTTAAGDASVLIDAVTIVRRDPGQVFVRNPSFEASDTPESPGYATMIGGWTTVGNVGINDTAGPFADNGTVPDQDRVVFIQQAGSIEQVLSGIVAAQSYTVNFAYNARTGNVPHLRVSVDGSPLFDEDVTAVGGAAAYRAGTFNFTAAGVPGTATTATLTFEQTDQVADVTVLLDDVRVSGLVVEPIPNLKVGPPQLEVAVGLAEPISVTVSGKRREQGDSVVQLRAGNPAVATLEGADLDGVVTLTFPGGPVGSPDLTLMVNATGVGRGVTGLTVVDDGGHEGVDGSVVINAVSSFVRNPSFETNPPGAFPTYGPITAWASTGGSGVNNSSGPFADNGTIPDGSQVGFIQGTQTISQSIVGLTPGKRYWLQFFYNAREAGGTAISLTMRYGGTVLGTIDAIDSSGGYRFHNQSFVPAAASGLLEFSGQTAVDATVLLDAVNILEREEGEVVIINPSFEASGVPTGVGYLSGPMAGWVHIMGGKGINIDTVGPFTDNGIAGDQDRVGFLQNAGALSQLIDGLTPGADYTLSFLINARNCCTLGTDTPYSILIDGSPLIDEAIAPVGIGVPYHLRELSFSPAATSIELTIQSNIPAGEDHSLLFDGLRIRPGGGGGTTVTLSIALVAGNAIELRWPATGPSTLKLQTSTTLAIDQWVDDPNPPTVIDGQNVVIQALDGPLRFFQLAPP